jgi:hypothetical protein
MKRFVCSLAVGLLAVFAGCSEEGPKVYPVSGQLLVNGQPAAGATVFFHRVSAAAPANDAASASRPFAIVQADGTFQPTTYLKNDGVAEGEYVLTVVWPTRTMIEGEEIEGPDQLRGRYAQAASPATKVKVVPGENKIPPIHLQTR